MVRARTGTALVVGAARIIGDAVRRELDDAGWTVHACYVGRFDHASIQADLTAVISDVNKIYKHGLAERMNSTTSLLGAIDSLKRQRILR